MFADAKFLLGRIMSSLVFLVVIISLCSPFKDLRAQDQSDKVFLTMEEAISRALVHNNQLRSSDFALKKADWDKLHAWTLLLPTVSFDTRFTRLDEQTFAERDFRRYLPDEIKDQFPQTVFQESYYSAFSLNATLFNGTLINNIFVANKAEDMAEDLNKSARHNTIFQVVSGYLNVLKSRELYKLQEEYLELSKLNYEKAERLYKADRYSKNEALRWQVDYQQQKSNVVNNQSYLRSSIRMLNRLINIELANESAIDGRVPDYLIMESENISNMTDDKILGLIDLNDDQLVMANAALSAAKSNEEITELLHRNSYTAYLPNVSLNYSYAWRENNTLAFDDYSPKTLSINFSLPIFTSFQNYTSLKSSYYDYKKSEEDFKDQLLNTKLILTETANKILNLKIQKELSKTNADYSENNYRIVSQQKEKGLVSNIDFIDAKLNWQNAELNSVNTEYDFISAIVELYYLLGRIEDLIEY